jgi:6-phospho-beta-glucosidase
VLPELIDEHGDELAEQLELPRRLLDELGAVPSYYLRYFYAHDRVLAEQLGETPRAVRVAEIEAELLEMYRDPSLAEKPALLEQRGGAFYSEAAVGLVRSLATGDGGVHEVDVRNDGTLAGLADDDVVEVPASVTRDALEPLPQAPLAPELLGLTQHVAAYERLAVEAAVTRDADIARKALLTHPLVGQYELSNQLFERLLEEARV